MRTLNEQEKIVIGIVIRKILELAKEVDQVAVMEGVSVYSSWDLWDLSTDLERLHKEYKGRLNLQ